VVFFGGAGASSAFGVGAVGIGLGDADWVCACWVATALTVKNGRIADLLFFFFRNLLFFLHP
jgi:hypothetical protein